MLEVNGHMADLRRDAGKGEEEGDVLEILPVQMLFGKHTSSCLQLLVGIWYRVVVTRALPHPVASLELHH